MNKAKLASLTVFLMAVSSALMAQPGATGGGGGTGGSTPIDGGISLLIAGIAGYGVKKIRDSRKAKNA